MGRRGGRVCGARPARELRYAHGAPPPRARDAAGHLPARGALEQRPDGSRAAGGGRRADGGHGLARRELGCPRGVGAGWRCGDSGSGQQGRLGCGPQGCSGRREQGWLRRWRRSQEVGEEEEALIVLCCGGSYMAIDGCTPGPSQGSRPGWGLAHGGTSSRSKRSHRQFGVGRRSVGTGLACARVAAESCRLVVGVVTRQESRRQRTG
mmetsp:Transcript_6237/g.18682  ORF Transcript_6237/g.18682 Transcript_6237/m.18682 type:complete len:208 (-) Transcript_6237:137-760(-)